MNLATVHHLPTPPNSRATRVNSWRWNELEDEALESLPPEIERLYLRGIRKYMDYATGVTGVKRRVCMDGFMELLNYYPPAGSKEKPRLYSRQQITRMIDKLESAGLVVRLHRGKGVKAAMEFKLPLACNDAEQQRAESEQVGASHTNPHGCHLQAINTEQGASKEERATSGVPVNPKPPLTTFEGEPSASSELELTPPDTPKPKPSATPYPDDFEAAWSAYPKRAGGNPKKSAFKAWSARRKQGVPAETMQAGVERYAAYIQAKGDDRTEFVMQAQRFFGPNAEYDNDWLPPATRTPQRQDGRMGFAQPMPVGSYGTNDLELPAWARD